MSEISKFDESSDSTRTEKRKGLDNLVLEVLENRPGLTLKQIEKVLAERHPDLKLGVSFLTNSLRRLEDEENKILSQTLEDVVHGKIINTYYTKSETLDEQNIQQIIFKKQELEKEIDYSENQEIIAYAIDHKKIAIGIKDNEYYSKIGIFSFPFTKQIRKEDGVTWIQLQFPSQFIEFYNIRPRKCIFKFNSDERHKAIVIERIPNIESKKETKSTPIKKILLLEDVEEWVKELKDRLEDKGHHVVYATTLEEFDKCLETKGPFDFVSIDKRIIEEEENYEDVAGELFFKVKAKYPNAKVGILTRNIQPSEKDYYKKLGFTCILQKKSRNRTGFNEIGEELVATLNVI